MVESMQIYFDYIVEPDLMHPSAKNYHVYFLIIFPYI